MGGPSRSTATRPQAWRYWLNADAVEVDGEWILYTLGAGDNCVDGRLAEAARLTLSHDEALVAATREINQILDRVAAANADSGRDLRFVITPYGRALAWTRADICGGSEPDAIARALGISPEAQRAAGPLRDWVIDEEGNLICCRRGANTQGVAELFSPANPTGAQDAALARCTEQINAILEATASKEPGTDPNLVLALLSTPSGLFLAWTINDDETNENPPGAITAASNERTISRALGLATPAGGGPPWKVILPIATVGAAGAGIVIAIAAGVFSGDDGSSAMDAIPSATARVTEALGTLRPTAIRTTPRQTEVPADASPTIGVEPTSPAGSTVEPTAPPEPTSNLEPTRQPTRPAATRTPNVPPQT